MSHKVFPKNAIRSATTIPDAFFFYIFMFVYIWILMFFWHICIFLCVCLFVFYTFPFRKQMVSSRNSLPRNPGAQRRETLRTYERDIIKKTFSLIVFILYNDNIWPILSVYIFFICFGLFLSDFISFYLFYLFWPDSICFYHLFYLFLSVFYICSLCF